MIPKVIHYCWFGRNPLPDSALKCIESWKQYCPDYEIKEWNEDNFDVYSNTYIAQAYEVKKYAFVSDYARFWILNRDGGIYFDTDVELIKPIDDILKQGPFLGCEKQRKGENQIRVAPGLGMAAEANMKFLQEMDKLYNSLVFKNENGTLNEKTIVSYTTEMLKKYGLRNVNEKQNVAGFIIYPEDFFCPLDPYTAQLDVTENTYSIHLYTASWHTGYNKFKKKVIRMLGPQMTQQVMKIKRIFKGEY